MTRHLRSLNRSADTAQRALRPGNGRSKIAQAVSLAVLTGAASAPLSAQKLEEVVVTATKRSESLMDVPLSITAISGAETRLLNLNDIKDLISFTPGITGNSKDSFLDTVSVRGIRTNLFGNGAEPSIGFYVNGLYQGRTGSAVSSLYDIERSEVLRGPQGFLFPRGAVTGAFNVMTQKASVEDGLSGYGELDVGERGVLVFEGAVNVPLTDNLAMRIAGFHTEEDGYVKNLAGGPDLIGHDSDSLRVSFRYETEKLTGDLIFQYDDRNRDGSIYQVTGEGPNFNGPSLLFLNGGEPFEVARGTQTNSNDRVGQRDEAEVFSLGLVLEYDLGWATLSSLTGYKDHDYEYGEDYDGLPITLYEYEQFQSGDYIEQELRLTSQSDGPLSWYAGASVYKEDIDTLFGAIQEEDIYCDLYLNYYYAPDQRGCTGFYEDYLGGYYDFTASTNGLINDYNETLGTYEGYSMYFEVGYEFSQSFDMTAGIRYSYDERDYSNEKLPDIGGSQFGGGISGMSETPEGPVSDSADWDAITYRVAANWRPNDTTLLFGSVATGYKPGGYDVYGFENNATGTAVAGPALPGRDRPADFDEETITAYELGYKGRLMDGRVQLSVTAFLYEYKDLQAFFSEQNPDGPGTRTVGDNVGVLDGWGSEIEVNAALTDNVTLRLGGSWLDSEANDVQPFCGAAVDLGASEDACEGEPLPLAPEFTFFAVLNGSFPVGDRGGELFANLAYSWEDDSKGDWIPEDLSKQTIRFLDQTDIVVGYQEEDWSISGYVENVFDNNWVDGTFGESFDGTPYAQFIFGPSRPRTAGLRASINF
ncbi:TonB-dependent receptor domain protein [Luminiphilus syltensis NOR5-1B]|uniref:TonB-dependent receptor domain protein n=1 Tax=Luminiphilus syltensis NOR5-1B TaxID=565045 RepID=B8KTT1_9GAMM|nr:TonB-dependent receptor [Luminiphilus syltensis]EED35107.1 TonB-dependent receptor domain protein [Luminiphilus syltensis NOR5-1B]